MGKDFSFSSYKFKFKFTEKRLSRIWNWVLKEKGLLLLAFALVFIKKWEPGGHIDATWYSSLARNIAESGDFFHFSINPFFASEVYDHFPLDYWIMGGLMSLFGVSDFVARSYFLVCSFLSYLFFFGVANQILGRRYAYISLIVFALCLGATKWSGAIKHDVPLTLAFLASTYFFIRSLRNPKYLLALAPLFVFGVFVKGPVIFGFPLALILWSGLGGGISWMRNKEFVFSLGLLFALLWIPNIEALQFDGESFYWIFLQSKWNYLNVGASQESSYLFYWKDLVIKQPHIFLLFLSSILVLILKRKRFSWDQKKKILLCGIMVLSILGPLSMFSFKLSYYSLPALPFYALISSVGPYYLLRNKDWNWSLGIFRLALATILIFVALPIKTTGARHKRVTNMVNQVKLLNGVKARPLYFLGYYDEDMSIFQEFKFYGGLDLRSARRRQLSRLDPDKVQLVVRIQDLPVQVGPKEVDESDCWIRNSQYCVYMPKDQILIELPEEKWPQEVYD